MINALLMTRIACPELASVTVGFVPVAWKGRHLVSSSSSGVPSRNFLTVGAVSHGSVYKYKEA